MRPIIGRRKEDGDDRESKAVVGFRAAYVLDGLSRDFRESSLTEAELGKLVLFGG